ncbi:MAG: ribonuclease Y [Bacilli bacterium]|jgi:ribonuclease Y|nr:ribonuclease Y [Bacilli bacterium]
MPINNVVALSTEGWIGIAVGALALGVIATIVVFKLIPSFKRSSANKQAKQILRDAEIKAERIAKNAEIDAKQAAFESKQNAQNEIRQMKSEIQGEQAKLDLREQTIDARDNALLQKENALDAKNDDLKNQMASCDKKQAELDSKIDGIIVELEKVSGMSVKEAHAEIMARVESKMSAEIAAYIKNQEDEAEETAQAKATDLLGLACDRYAQEVTTERNVAVIALPTDELKGRIIGREGRNIRVLEQTLGVDLVIDDTPEVITISCFDPIRREIARRTMEYLVKDGRIQPGRIEEIAAKFKRDVQTETQKVGEDAAFKLGLPKISKELCGCLGRLKYRTSYGQNALQHSMEVASLTGMMAAELGLDQNLAKRAGLLHDIGKAVDFEQEGSHVQLGADLARKYGEPDVVINSIESHHGDVPAKYVIAHLVAAADTLSAARPGARSETMENYVKRITQLEDIAKTFDGVQQAYAMQAGREIRVMVIPERVSDDQAVQMALKMREKIESEMTYPGQIKVSVIREYRAVETAK